ncbi:outer membrane protein assembly factor BamA [uncultured Deefgea sp.]|uniref:outer membrane protein assembly factor BamA n=1 Tax=uncultured Deefgea sp. TaxID=1304914 RepID=UPI00261094D5|nr:outer membrane protein assembly factor BamA [uncultured Deefgea sp.]
MKFKPMYVLVAAAFASISLAAQAFNPITVQDIRVEGLQRTDPGTVFNYLTVKVGDKFDETQASEAIRALFATGFFDDVRIEVDKNVIVITVEERPTVAQINVNGAKLLEKEQVKAAFKGQNLAEGRIFQQEVLDAAVNELKQQYYARGRYSVDVKTTVTKLDRNRVGVQVDIAEGDVAKIKSINFVGNKVYSQDDLISQMSLTTPTWMTWYTKTDQYSKPKFGADLEAIKSLYLDNGYLNFAIESTQVALSEDKADVFLTINLREGDLYRTGDISFAGNFDLPEAELKALVAAETGEIFSRDTINKTTAAISDRLGKEGHAFPNVNAVPTIDEAKKTVAFTFFVDPGKKTSVRRVNIYGNNLTKDEVLRREVRQMESAEYNLADIKRTKERLQQLDFFSEVNIDTPVVPESSDLVDMNINVVEKKTGNLNFGVGYGQGEGALFQASISQANFLGTGKRFSAEVNTSQASKVLAFGMNNPYATPDGVSFGWTAYLRDTDPGVMDLGQYQTQSKGVGFNFGMPTTEYNSIGLGINAEIMDFKVSELSPDYVLDYIKEYGKSAAIYSLNANWATDSRDSAVFPTKGFLFKTSAELGVPPSDINYYKLNLQSQYFYSLPTKKPFTFMWNMEVGYGGSYGDSNEYPFYKNFYAGGVNSVRGYKSGSLGPIDNTDNSMGGSTRFVNNFEVFAPVPGMKDDKSMRLSAFYDAGNVWGYDQDITFSSIQHSVGVGFTWISPIGPLKLIYAHPINPSATAKTESIQFQIGQLF